MSENEQAGVTSDQVEKMDPEERRRLETAHSYVRRMRVGHDETGQGEHTLIAWYMRGVAGGLSAVYHIARRLGSLPSAYHDLLTSFHVELGEILSELKRGKRG